MTTKYLGISARIAVFGMAVATTLLSTGCTPPPIVEEVRHACAQAPDRSACEDAEYARRAAAERARFNYGRHYW